MRVSGCRATQRIRFLLGFLIGSFYESMSNFCFLGLILIAEFRVVTCMIIVPLCIRIV